MGAVGSVIESEVSLGIPLMRMQGGFFEGMQVITKAGAFGDTDAVSYALRKRKEA